MRDTCVCILAMLLTSTVRRFLRQAFELVRKRMRGRQSPIFTVDCNAGAKARVVVVVVAGDKGRKGCRVILAGGKQCFGEYGS